MAVTVSPAFLNRAGWGRGSAVALLWLKVSLQGCACGCSIWAEQRAAGGHHTLLGYVPTALGAGSYSLPSSLWIRMKQMPFPFKLEILTTFLAGFQKAAQNCGNKRILAAEEEKKKKANQKTLCLLLYHIHSCSHTTASIPLAGHPVSSYLLQKTHTPKNPRKKLDSFTSSV